MKDKTIEWWNLRSRTQIQALEAVLDERDRQDGKWGEQNHDLPVWMTVLGEEFGEACMAILELRAGNGLIGDVRRELVEVAAVAIATLEYLERAEKFVHDSSNSREEGK